MESPLPLRTINRQSIRTVQAPCPSFRSRAAQVLSVFRLARRSLLIPAFSIPHPDVKNPRVREFIDAGRVQLRPVGAEFLLPAALLVFEGNLSLHFETREELYDGRLTANGHVPRGFLPLRDAVYDQLEIMGLGELYPDERSWEVGDYLGDVIHRLDELG